MRDRLRSCVRCLRLWPAALVVWLLAFSVSVPGAAATASGSGSRPSTACIDPGCLTFQGRMVWEAGMTVGTTRLFAAYSGPLTDSGFSWRGATYTVSGVFLARSLQDPETSNVSIHFVPELPDEARSLQLQIGGSGLNLADGDSGGGNFYWRGVDVDWSMGETVTVSLKEFPAQIEHRSIDGRSNNFRHPSWGAAGTAQLRIAPTSYRDRVLRPVVTRPNPRTVSNLVFAQQGPEPNSSGASDFIWQWGQFLSHDIVLSNDNLAEPLPIRVPRGDPVFGRGRTGGATIGFNRSEFHPATGTGRANPRRQTNATTAFIDASHIYGPQQSRALALRARDGTGGLATSRGGRFLPFNTQGLPNEGGAHLTRLFVGGDVRANEQIGLIAMHTLFVREHNRLAGIIAGQDPDLSGDEIYQLARRIVTAQNQAITFNEFLPVLIGADAMGEYSGYDPSVDPSIASEFSAAAFRVGHTMLAPDLLLVGTDGRQERVSLAASFFNPRMVIERGISAILLGLAAQPAQRVDTLIIDEVRNMLIKGPGGPALDLAALNIQRGRDHGLGDYNTVRLSYGLAPAESIADISSDPEVQRSLRLAYDDIADLDLWVAALAEDHLEGAMVGETLRTIIADQFRRLRDGDRFWFENDPYFLANPALLDEVRSTTLADIIRRNTPISDEIQDNAFIVASSN